MARNLIFLECLVENLGNHSHGWAMQKLKEEFGGQRGMPARRKKLADKIVRETPQRTMPQLPSGPVMQLPPPPQQFFGGGLGMMAPTHQSHLDLLVLITNLYRLVLINSLCLGREVSNLQGHLEEFVFCANNLGIWRDIVLFSRVRGLLEIENQALRDSEKEDLDLSSNYF